VTVAAGSPWQQFGTGNYETLHDMPIAAGEVLAPNLRPSTPSLIVSQLNYG
jgi:hypothetical protein